MLVQCELQMLPVDEKGSARKWAGGGETGDDDSGQVAEPAIKAEELFGRLVNLSWPQGVFLFLTRSMTLMFRSWVVGLLRTT